jgi:phage terminase small subunit
MNQKREKSTDTLCPREESFCILYATIGTEFYSNATEAAIKAGYSERGARTAAWRLLRRPRVRLRITELYREQAGRAMLTADKVLADLEHNRREALKAGKFSDANRAIELMAKVVGLLGNNPNLSEIDDMPERPKLTKSQMEAFRKKSLKLVKEIERDRQKVG